MKGTDHYVVISSDCHAGASLEMYREYLTPKWQEEFDAWRGAYKNPFRDLQGDGRTRNWDDERRFSDQDGEGVVAEVIFPNTVPPFFPTGSVIAPAPSPEEYERRRIGIQAHNRWLADFVAVAPNRRAGQTQIFLNDVDDAIEDAIWGQEHGLRGILLPGVSPDTQWIDPLYHPKYDPLWRVCEERGIPVSHHAGGTGIPKSPQLPCSVFMFVMETGFWANRALWHFILSGVFERFPDLKLVLTEQGSRWVPAALNQMDTMIMAAVESLDGHKEAEMVRSLLDVRDNLANRRGSDARSTEVVAIKTGALDAVNVYFERRLFAIPGIKTYLDGLRATA